MVISSARISSGVGVFPTPYVGDWADAGPHAHKISAACRALNRIVHAPIARYPPRLNRVVRPLNAVSLVMVRWYLEKRGQFRARRLHLPKFIGAARLQYTLLPVPLPVHAKSRMRFRMDRAADLRLFPRLPGVRRNFYAPHGATTRPCQPCQLVDSRTGEL